jgi:hypothetical protein
MILEFLDHYGISVDKETKAESHKWVLSYKDDTCFLDVSSLWWDGYVLQKQVGEPVEYCGFGKDPNYYKVGSAKDCFRLLSLLSKGLPSFKLLSLEQALEGKLILDIQKMDQGYNLTFTLEDSIVQVEVTSDMCAAAYIETVDYDLEPSKLFPTRLVSISSESSEDWGEQYHSCCGGQGLCEFTFITFHLEKGRVHVEFRVESSGAYSGNLETQAVLVVPKQFIDHKDFLKC